MADEKRKPGKTQRGEERTQREGREGNIGKERHDESGRESRKTDRNR